MAISSPNFQIPFSLSLLAFYENPITGSFPTKTIGNLVELDHLDLTSTLFTGGMPSEIGALTKLTYLFMAGMNFTAGTIPDEYQSLTSLEDLSLKRSQRTGVCKLTHIRGLAVHFRSHPPS